MSTAIDSNVITALWYEDDALNQPAMQALNAAYAKGDLTIAAPVYAELLAGPDASESKLDAFLSDAEITVDWKLPETMWRAAGLAFHTYRNRRRLSSASSTPRRVLADFLIGAHALINGHALLTLDKRLYKSAFPGLKILTF